MSSISVEAPNLTQLSARGTPSTGRHHERGIVLPGENLGASAWRVDLGAFYEAHGQDLRKAFRKRARGYGLEVEDVVQEVMLRAGEQVVANPDEFDSDDALLAWCVVVGWNHMADLAKRAHRRREEPHPSPASIVSHVDRVDVAGQLADSDELARVLAQLLPQYEQVLRLDAEGHSREDISTTLGISPEATSQLLYRARKAFRRGWLKAVAAIVVLGAGRARKLRSAYSSPAQALVASVVTLSVVVALVFPLPGVGTPSTRGATPDAAAVSATSPPAARHSVPTARKTSTRASVATRVSVVRPQGRPVTPALLPQMPGACAPDVCVGSCPNKPEPGDRLYVKPLGDCALQVTEAKAPICQYIADNPVVGCERYGKPQWTVSPPPPPRSLGAPL